MHGTAVEASLFLLALAYILLDLDQARHGQLDSPNQGVDHIHVRHGFDQLFLSGWYVSLPRQQLHSLQQSQHSHQQSRHPCNMPSSFVTMPINTSM